MNTIDVLIDFLQDNQRRVHQLVEAVSDDCLYWQPDPAANNIAVTIWHCARVFDVFLTQCVYNQPATAELWAANQWSEKTGYDPYGIGINGWGTLQGYTPDEVAAIPNFSREQLLGYFDEMITAVSQHLQSLTPDQLQASAPGYDGKQSVYFWLRTPTLDLTRHMGEMMAQQAAWERQQQ